MDEEFATTLDNNIEDAPQEVRDFIFGSDFQIIKNQILQNIDKEDERLEFSNILMFYLFGSKTASELDSYIQALSISEEKKVVIKKSIQENIVDEILLLIEVHQEMDQAAAVITNAPDTVITSQPKIATTSLTALADRLKQSSASTALTRTYSLEAGTPPTNLPITEPTTAPVEPAPRTIDPYHEPIEK